MNLVTLPCHHTPKVVTQDCLRLDEIMDVRGPCKHGGASPGLGVPVSNKCYYGAAGKSRVQGHPQGTQDCQSLTETEQYTLFIYLQSVGFFSTLILHIWF